MWRRGSNYLHTDIPKSLAHLKTKTIWISYNVRYTKLVNLGLNVVLFVQNQQHITVQLTRVSNMKQGFVIFQGVGGTVQYPRGYLKRAFEIVREKGGVCISDEVSSAFILNISS